MNAADGEQWDTVYASKPADRVSWFRPRLDRSLAFVDAAGLPSDAGIIDVGGGASTLVDDLLDRGYVNLTVLDLSRVALDVAKTRLGPRASGVRWLCADVTKASLPAQAYDLWHDRAVFHFLTEPDQRRRYVSAVRQALKPGGHIVIATFGPNGPTQCSGHQVLRLSADDIHAELGEGFVKVGSETEIHTTPWGAEQEFVYCHSRLMTSL